MVNAEIFEVLKKVDFLKFLPESILPEFTGSCEKIKLASDQVLFNEGEDGDFMFIVLSGELGVYKNKREIGRPVPGGYFGEMALVNSKPRSATVKALVPSQLLVITKEQFQSHFASSPAALMALMQTLSNHSRGNLDAVAEDHGKLQDRENLHILFRRVLDDATNEIYIYDDSLAFMEVNRRACENLGYGKNDLLGLNYANVAKGICQEKLEELLAPLRSGEKSIIQQKGFHIRKDGSEYPVEMSIQMMQTETVPLFATVALDRSERETMQEKIRIMALYDSLTGLPNRNLAIDRLELATARALRNEDKAAVFLLDMDNFKTVNDSLGRKTGDKLLQAIGKRLVETLRKEDTVARVGEDEFMVIASVNKESKTARLAQKLLDGLNVPFVVGEHEIYVHFSMGISIYPSDGQDPQTLLANADAALHRAKEKGKNTFENYNPSLLARASRQLTLESGLRKALEREEFRLHYQPKVDINTGRIDGLEALIRWQHPEDGLMAPGLFIPAAEESRLIVPMGEWALNEACQQIAKWTRMGIPNVNVAVNLSGLQFVKDNLVETVSRAVSDAGISPKNLELELTESILMENSQKAIARLAELNALGIKISIDDFGTGYSSLMYLKIMPFHTLKIDRTFVNDVTKKTDAEITKAIISLAQILDKKTVAEGVETEDQQNFLRRAGCDLIQGYLISKPLPAEDVVHLLKKSM